MRSFSIGRVCYPNPTDRWDDFKYLIKAARKQKRHLKWVQGPAMYDLRDRSEWTSNDVNVRAAWIIYSNLQTPRRQFAMLPAGLITTYPYMTCCKCDAGCDCSKASRKIANVGYWILEEYAGKGIVSSAMEIFVRRMKCDGFEHLSACTADGNLASEGVLKKLGFHRVRRSKRDCYIVAGESLHGSNWILDLK